ncbi:MAG TPA: RluA family pseudouridine synthase [Blastocatellia bacterium]|nr:RluA family pseudouridine synthase [Blastocatellia bacterium]
MLHRFNFHIEETEAGQRLDDFLADRFGSLSRMRIANLIEAGAATVNDEKARAGYRILPGEYVELMFEDDAPTAMTPEPTPLEVCYEDEHLIVVVKPAGLLVHPTMNVKRGTLVNALTYHFNKARIDEGRWTVKDLAAIQREPVDQRSSIVDSQSVIRPGLVHRLDRDTSGLMVVAKTDRAMTVLSRHCRRRLVEKRYLGLVSGRIDAESGSIEAPIGRDPEQEPHWRVIDTGKPAHSKFKVVDRFPRATLIELEPVTGRTNQLRIHCAYIGHPIIGDQMHGGNQETERRLCLHASRLSFHHPANGNWMELTSPTPDQMQSIVSRYQNS